MSVNELEGLIFNSTQFGYCKVVAQNNRQVKVRFCGTDRETLYTLETFLRGKDFKWKPLPVGLHCKVPGRGECCIVQSPFKPDETSQVHEYAVEFPSEGNASAKLSERDLWPIAGSVTETPETKLAAFQLDPWKHFRAREDLLAALNRLHQETAGIRALGSSRIELLAHQAFVIGTVIDDARWRYILADEVGLGKTIEAGVILHELLAERPQARVLILTPGPLSRQWLCEMHTSFGGREFKLADLHEPHQVNWSGWSRVICSLKTAVQLHPDRIRAQKWDLIVVDEGHHLLWNPTHYDFVKELSVEADGILILSAVPARERSTELLRLLQLVDPQAYANGSKLASHFEELYREQPLIGRRLRILQNRLSQATVDGKDIYNAAHRLLEIPLLSQDPELQSALQRVAGSEDPADLQQQGQGLMHEVASRYRISRRILKNRRARLTDQSLLQGVERRLTTAWYAPAPLETGAHEVLVLLFSRLLDAGAPSDALQILFRKAVTALCDPVALMEIAVALGQAEDPEEAAESDLDPSAVLDYEEHERLVAQACTALGPYKDAALNARLLTYAQAWITSTDTPPRVTRLIQVLDELLAQESPKVVVFAGTLGAAELLLEQLQQQYGKATVAEFRHDLDDDEKESEAIKFRRNPECRILVCDESGGEGRNFQFATALVHYDLPWSVAAVEQRIGRLDRIGRTDPVESVVVAAQGSVEADWLKCLSDGFEVFGRSISGLEFMLRDAEHRVVEHIMHYGPDQIDAQLCEVQETCIKERASDEADALTDLASFNRSLRRVGDTSHTADARIEESFPRYMRTIGVGSVARRVTDQRDMNLRIWCLRPEDVTQVQLPGIHRSTNGQLGDHYGTFLRTVARDRPDLEFFSTGNGLFDAVCEVAQSHMTGRTFAIQVTSETLPQGLYVLSTWKVCPDASAADEKRLGLAMRHLYGRRIRILAEAATGTLVDSATVRSLESLLTTEDTAITDVRDKGVALIEGAQSQWPALVSAITARAKARVPSENHAAYVGEDQDFAERMTQEIARLKQWGRGDSAELVAAIEACLASVRNPVVALDSLGVVQITEGSNVTATVP